MDGLTITGDEEQLHKILEVILGGARRSARVSGYSPDGCWIDEYTTTLRPMPKVYATFTDERVPDVMVQIVDGNIEHPRFKPVKSRKGETLRFQTPYQVKVNEKVLPKVYMTLRGASNNAKTILREHIEAYIRENIANNPTFGMF